jgi:hypothetical protein
MALTDLSSAQLEHLIELVTQREALQAKLKNVERSLAQLTAGNTTKATGVRGTRKKRRQPRGKLKQGILGVLTSAGKRGLTVRELAEQLKAKPTSVSVWFYTTGKKVEGIKKVGKARFAYI